MIWNPFPESKPEEGQSCIVAAGPDNVAQHVALIWDGENFTWPDGVELDPFPTEAARFWMPFPNDPGKGETLFGVIKDIRKSDCGAWLKDCHGGLFRCSDGREKRQELCKLLDKLYKIAGA